MKVSKNFHLVEFLYPELIEIPNILPVWFIDKRVFTIAQALRDRFGKPVTINNWAYGGIYQFSGLRPFFTTIGARLSIHKFGKAIDPKVEGIEAIEVQEDIIKNWHYYKEAGLTTIEYGTQTWTHMDCRNTNSNELFIIKV